MKRISTPFIGVALVAGAVWVAMQSYQKNFAGPAVSETDQQRLGIQLLEFPRQLPALNDIPNTQSGEWFLLELKPELCDALCQGKMQSLSDLNVAIAEQDHPAYVDLSTIVTTEGYAIHRHKVLLINPDGKFAGSLAPPYSKAHLEDALKALNP